MPTARIDSYAHDRHLLQERDYTVLAGSSEVGDNASHQYDSSSRLVGNATTVPESLLTPSGLAVVFFAYSLAFVLIVAGNVAAIVVFTRGRRSRTDVRIFFINLAVADLIVGIVCLPISSVASTVGWVLPEFMCPVAMFLQLTSVTTTVYMNCALSIDRFIAVRYPLKRLTLPKHYIPAVVGVVWIVSAGVSSVQLAVSRVVADPMGTKEPECKEDWRDDSFMKYYSIIVLVITYGIPACLLVIMYGFVCHELWRRLPPGVADEGREKRQLKSKQKVVRMLIIMAALFISSWLPLHLLFILLHFYPGTLEHLQTEKQVAKYYYFAHLLAISSSFQNPIIYGFLNGNFRSDLAELLLRCCPYVECLAVMKRAAASRATSLSSSSPDIAPAQPSKLRLRIVPSLRGPSSEDRGTTRTCHRMLSNASCQSTTLTPEPDSAAVAIQAMESWSRAVGSACWLSGGEEELANGSPPADHGNEAQLPDVTSKAATGDRVVAGGVRCAQPGFKDRKYYHPVPGGDSSESAPFISNS